MNRKSNLGAGDDIVKHVEGVARGELLTELDGADRVALVVDAGRPDAHALHTRNTTHALSRRVVRGTAKGRRKGVPAGWAPPP